MKIIVVPNNILLHKSKTVKAVAKTTLQFIKQMKKTLETTKDPIGVGLAACQVGNPLSIFLMKSSPKAAVLAFINPKIIKTQNSPKENEASSSEKEKNHVEKLEGCLSIPTIWGEVMRPTDVIIEYLDENSVKHIKKFSGLKATIIQHEMDHLNGILFTSRVLEQNGDLYKSSKNKHQEDIFEKIEL